MSSVLAIVSKVLFEKMVPKGVKLGAVVDTNQYVSANKTFDGIGKGDAIFLVTVRPPDEKLWLVGILESPKKKGDAWTSKANEAPLTDITGAIKKLTFTSGTGIKAKKGALGMSLQTPRGLTDEDVELLRGFVDTKPAKSSAKVHANDAYMKAVDAVVHKHKGAATNLGKFRLENKRKPFAGKLADLKPFEKKQVQAVLGKSTPIESMFGKKADEDEEGSELVGMEIVDVVDTGTEKVVYQLMIWPYGDGSIVHNETINPISHICQHGLDPVEDIGKAWTRDFARAWVEGSKRLKLWSGHIDFSEEELGESEEDDDE